MADYGLTIDVLDKDTLQPIEGATVSGTVSALDGQDHVVPCITDARGRAVVTVLNLSIRHPQYLDYIDQPYRRPSLQAPVTVHLRRR
jgi:hypothetical protein